MLTCWLSDQRSENLLCSMDSQSFPVQTSLNEAPTYVCRSHSHQCTLFTARYVTLPRQSSLGFKFRQHRFQHLVAAYWKVLPYGNGISGPDFSHAADANYQWQCHLPKKCSKLLNYCHPPLPLSKVLVGFLNVPNVHRHEFLSECDSVVLIFHHISPCVHQSKRSVSW